MQLYCSTNEQKRVEFGNEAGKINMAKMNVNFLFFMTFCTHFGQCISLCKFTQCEAWMYNKSDQIIFSQGKNDQYLLMCYKTVLCMKFMYRGMRAKQNV